MSIGRCSYIRVHFRRLFHLSLDKNISVAEMNSLGWGNNGGGWRWTRRLFAWEDKLLKECYLVLANLFCTLTF
jgi:hypothetical protein